MSNVINLPSLKDRAAARVELNRREQITSIDEAISAAWASLSMGPEMTRKVVGAIIERLDGAPMARQLANVLEIETMAKGE